MESSFTNTVQWIEIYDARRKVLGDKTMTNKTMTNKIAKLTSQLRTLIAAGPVYFFRNKGNKWGKLTEAEVKELKKGKRGEYGKKGKQDVAVIKALPAGFSASDAKGGSGFVVWDYSQNAENLKIQFTRLFQDEDSREKKSKGFHQHVELLKQLGTKPNPGWDR